MKPSKYGKADTEAIQSLADSSAGQALAQYAKGSADLQQALRYVSDGNMTQAKDTIERFLATPDAQALVRQLQKALSEDPHG